MATTLSNSKSWQAPFFGKSSIYVGGQDPLGLQATSVAAFSRLLPGITTQTNRVRYWSFYCWIIHLFSRRIHKTGYERFVDFIRRCEFTLAVATELTAPNETAIFGRDAAKLAAKDLPLDLKKYADNKVQGIFRYYKKELGGFDLYHAVMTKLGLLIKNDYGIFVCTDKSQNPKFTENLCVSGYELAKAFQDAIGNETEERFCDSIIQGFVTSEDLIDFGERMNFSAIQPETREWYLIKDIFTGGDNPGLRTKEFDTSYRLNTTRLFLDFCHLKKDTSEFPFWLEERNGLDTNDLYSDTSFGWFYYAINEHWHYANELIFYALLEKLRLNDFTELEVFIKKFSEEILISSISEEWAQKKFTPLNWLSFVSIEPANQFPEADAARGFKSILELFKIYSDRTNQFIQFGQRPDIDIQRRGDFGNGLRLIGTQIHLPFKDFIEWYLFRQIINRHSFVAMEKLAKEGKNTLTFKIEDQTLCFVNNISVRYKNPKLNQLSQFLRDLKVLDHENFPTENAITFLKPEKLSHS